MPKSLRFKDWAQPVRHRGFALVTVVLHRLQRMTSGLELAHRPVRRLEVAAWERATFMTPPTYS